MPDQPETPPDPQSVARDFRDQMRRDKIVPIANLPGFDASVGFDTLEEAIQGVGAFMVVAEDIDAGERDRAAYRDIALYRAGRILAVVRCTPHGPEVTHFAADIDEN